jgi:hypothetical protein
VVNQPKGGWRTRIAHQSREGRLGHASIKMTADVYGHLFPRGDDAAVENAFPVM